MQSNALNVKNAPAELTIRPFDYSDADYAAYVALSNTVYAPYLTTVAERRRADEMRASRYQFGRFVATRGDALVALASFNQPEWAYHPQRFSLNVTVDPAHRRRGIGGALYDYLLQAIAPYEPIKLTSWTFEDKTPAIRFLEQRGFTRTMRFPVSRLDLDAFDPAPFAWAEPKATARGIRFTTLAEWGDSEAHRRQMHAFDVQMTHDIPTPDPITPVPYAQWAKWLEEPSFSPALVFIALDGETIAGLSFLTLDLANRERLHQRLTGTDAAYRRLGIATALKTKGALAARSLGYREILTDNEENNPMYQINMRLGFRPLPAELAFAKAVS